MRFLGIGDYCDLGALYLRLIEEGHEVRISISNPLCSGTLAGLVERTPDWRDERARVEVKLTVAGLQEQITVTSGSRVEELQEDSPVKVDAVTRERMARTGYERLSDVLSESPGVVTRSGSSGAVSAEQIRGVGARQVAVLQDGLPRWARAESRAAI